MSKRKQHNPVKRYITQTLIAVKDLALVMRLSKDDKVDLVSCKSQAPVRQISQTLAKALGDTAFKWSVLLVVWAKESNGKDKIVTELVKTAPYRHEALTGYLRDLHQQMIDNCKAQVVDAGWCAMPNGWTDDIDEIMNCFEWTEESK